MISDFLPFNTFLDLALMIFCGMGFDFFLLDNIFFCNLVFNRFQSPVQSLQIHFCMHANTG